MAEFRPIQIVLKDGARVTVRSATPKDSRSLLLYVRNVLASSDHLIQMPDEFTQTPMQERAWIKKRLRDPNAIALLAIVEGGIVGMLDTTSDRRRRVQHTVRFGISVADGWRGRGIGTALVRTLLDWAGKHPQLERVELSVLAGNTRALALYERLGFKQEGRRRNAIKYGTGHYQDDILMALLLKGDHDHSA